MDPNTQALLMGAAGAGGAAEAPYVEDVFSTWLYNGTSSNQTITNGIDLSTKGGMVWIKRRDGAFDHNIFDTARGTDKWLISNSNAGQATGSNTTLTAFNTTGFSLGTDGIGSVNTNNAIHASWTFRKAAKFFDVVTYTGNGINRTISHSLGSVPGCIIVKRTNTAGFDWGVYHRSLGATKGMFLNLNDSAYTVGANEWWNATEPTSSVFSVGGTSFNSSGATYVAYLFAHETTASDVIQCGSFVGGAGGQINLGWEPQWLLLKNTTSAASWDILDNMRGIIPGNDSYLRANLASSEGNGDIVDLTATGFINRGYGNAAHTIAYIAIRRGPMRTPTDATKVFQPKVYTGTNVDNRLVTTDIVTDMAWIRQRNDTVLAGMVVGDRMHGQPYRLTGSLSGEVNDADSFDAQLVSGVEYGTAWSSMTGFWVGNDLTSKLNVSTTSNNHVVETFKRAPGFFDVVGYTGTSVARTISHNLGVAPEMIIVFRREGGMSYIPVYHSGLNNGTTPQNYRIQLNAVNVESSDGRWNSTAPTSSVFSVDNDGNVNGSGGTYIAYLFASCTGISKVGSYTGTGATKQIDCGFTAGARFVLIKRTNGTGSWYVWDTARNIISGNDPYLLLNSTAAEVTNTDYIDPLNSGFEISSTAPADINANGGSFIFLAIA